jgi:hypothetical protein
MEPLDVLLVLHFVLIIEGGEGLSVRISCIPELEGRPTLARELFLRSHECPLHEVGPPDRRLHCITI